MKKRLRILLPVLIVAAAVTAYVLYTRENVSGGAIKASGNIEVTDAQLAFRIAGRLAERLVDEGASVTSGSLVARLDPGDQQVALAQAQAAVAQSRAALAELLAGSRPEDIAGAEAQVEQMRAALAELERGFRSQEIADAKAAVDRAQGAVRSAEAQRVLARANFDRFKDLYAKKVVSLQEYQTSQTALDAAVAALDQAKAAADSAAQVYGLRVEGSRVEAIEKARGALHEAEAHLALLKAGARVETIDQARAALQLAVERERQSRLQLGYTELHAPFGGVVLSKAAEQGEFLTPGATVVTLGALDVVWVRAFINERDLARVKLGQEVEVRTDTTGGPALKGHLVFVSGQGEFTPKSVQTFDERVKTMYRIKVAVENPEHLLKPGMPADAILQPQR